MRIFKTVTLEEYCEVIDYIVNLDQPIYCYRDDLDEHLIISRTEIEDIESAFEKQKDSLLKEAVEIKSEQLDEVLTEADLDELSDWFLGV